MLSIYILLCFYLQVLLVLGSSGKLAKYPDHPCHMVGQPLRLVCTAPPGFSSTSINFRWVQGSKQMPHQGVTGPINETSAELSILHLSKNFKGWHLSCFVNDSIVDSKEIFVVDDEDKLRDPVVTSYVVENWKTFKFTWNGTELYSNSGYQAYFKNSSEPHYKVCPKYGYFSCTIENPFNVSGTSAEDTVVFIKVNGSDLCGVTRSPEMRLQLFDSVKPAPVKTLSAMVSPENIENIRVTFTPPAPYSIVYTFHVVCGDGTFNLTQNYTPVNYAEIASGSEMYYNFHGLPKFSNCVVYVSGVPSQGGYASETKQYPFRTAAGVPVAAPSVCSSCFSRLNNTSVVIFFKPIPTHLAQGNISNYRVKLTKFKVCDTRMMLYGQKTTELPADTKQQSLIVNGVEVDKRFKLRLDARTDKGYNDTLNLKVICIPARCQMPEKPEFHVIDWNITTVMVKWKRIADASSYTILWCSTSADPLSSSCKGNMDWLEVNANETLQVLTVARSDGSKRDISVGMAVESRSNGNDSSGIEWSSCHYSIDAAYVQMPTVSYQPVGCCSIQLRIIRPKCHPGYSYIDKYNITYEAVDDDEQRRINWLQVEAQFEETNVSLVDGVKPGVSYKVTVTSLSSVGDKSYPFTINQATTEGAGLTNSFIIIVCILSVVSLVLIAACMYGTLRYSRECWRKLQKCLSITIQIPEYSGQELHSDSAPYNAGSSSSPRRVHETSNHQLTIQGREDAVVLLSSGENSALEFIDAAVTINESAAAAGESVDRMLPVIDDDVHNAFTVPEMSDVQAVTALTTRTTADTDVLQNENDIGSILPAQREDSQFDDIVERPDAAAGSEGYKPGEATFFMFGPIRWHPETASATEAAPNVNTSPSPAESLTDVHMASAMNAAGGGKCLSRLLPELGSTGEQFAPLETNTAAAASYPALTVDEIRGPGCSDMGSSESVASYSKGRYVT